MAHQGINRNDTDLEIDMSSVKKGHDTICTAVATNQTGTAEDIPPRSRSVFKQEQQKMFSPQSRSFFKQKTI